MKNSKLQIRIQNYLEPKQYALKDRFGFTLIELVVVVGLVSLISITATSLFLTSIVGGGKVEVSTEVKQNGQFAVNVMEQLIRNSLSLEQCLTEQVTLVARDGQTLTFSCEEVDEGTGYIASNSARLTSTNVVVTSCEFVCNQDPQETRPPLVNVAFSIRQLEDSPETFEGASADFSTSVGLRNF